MFALLHEQKFQKKAAVRKSPSTLWSVSSPVYSLPLVSSTPIPPTARHEARKLQVGNCFKCEGKSHIAS